MSFENVQKLIKDNAIEFVDLRFADLRGVQHHVTFPVSIVEPALFEDGKMFDGSSISGWKGINESDMILLPDASTAVLDPFTADPTLILVCDILDPATMQAYGRDPRGVAKRAEAYLKASGIADQAFFGPEPEFFIFDSVRWNNEMGHTFFEVDSEEAHWNSKKKYEGGNTGYRPGLKGGYFPVAPTDSLHDIRAEMCKELMAAGQEVEVHHHEVANAGQCEIGTKFNTLVAKADELLMMKYIIKNVAHRNGKTATFMPKPLVGDNGSRHARAPVAGQGRREPVLRRRLRRPEPDGAVVHRRHLQARARHQRLRQLDHQQLQAPGAGLRSAGDAGLFGPQPLGFLPHPVRVQSEGAPHRNPLPGSDELRLPDLRRADDGRSGRHQEPDRSGRAVATRICTTCRRKKRRTSRPSATAWTRPGSAGQRPRVPESRRRVQRRFHRRLHRAEDGGSHQVPRGHPPAGIRRCTTSSDASPRRRVFPASSFPHHTTHRERL